MGESSAAIVALPRRTRGTVVPRHLDRKNLSTFGRVCLTLWPDKPALVLSQLAGCSERHANLLIRGDRKPNARIALALLGQILD
jgi:hypothetical protein